MTGSGPTLKAGCIPSAGADERGAPHEPCSGAEARLVAKAQEDDSQALEMLLRAHKDKIFALAYRLALADRDAALDLSQEILIRVARNIKRFKRKSAFSTWVHRIAINTWLSTQRREGRWSRMIRSFQPGKRAKDAHQEAEIPDRAGDPARIVSKRLFLRDLHNTVQSLPQKQRLVFQLKALQGMSIPEIAELTGMAQGTVKSHLFRATRTVREHMDDWMEK